MFQKQKVTLHTPPLVKICFLKEFVDSNYHNSILSVINSRQLWANEPHYIIQTGASFVYNNTTFANTVIQIPFPALANKQTGYLHAERIAKQNKTIVIYQHGTFQAVYDFRDKQ
jgi:hypothetical protein